MSSNDSTKNPTRVAAGLKSTLARDDVSDQAKITAQQRLDEMGATTDDIDHSLSSHAIGTFLALPLDCILILFQAATKRR
jgi:hypothetical protein